MVRLLFVLSFLLAFGLNDSRAQYSAFAHGAYFQFLKGNNIGAFGGGLKLGYEFEANTMVIVGFNHFGNAVDQQLSTATAVNIDTDPYKVNVAYDQSNRLTDFYIEGRYCFIGNWWNRYCFFANAGGGFAFIRQNEVLTGAYDQDLYALDFEVGQQHTIAEGSLFAGLGGELAVGPGSIFTEVKLYIPLEPSAAAGAIVDLPLTIVGQLGYRLYFGAPPLEQGE